MHWTEKEIIDQYKDAKDKRKVVKILADQYCCTSGDIRELLDRNGIEVPKAHKRKNAQSDMETENAETSNSKEKESKSVENAENALSEEETNTPEESKKFKEITLPLGGYVIVALTDAVESYAKEMDQKRLQIEKLQIEINNLQAASEEIEQFISNSLEQVG